MKHKLHTTFLFILLIVSPLFIHGGQSELVLYDVATEVGVIGKKNYLNNEGLVYKTEYLRTTEVKLTGPFDENKLVLFETEIRIYNDRGNEIINIRNDSNGHLRMTTITEYDIRQKIRIRSFDKLGHMFELKEFKDGKWKTVKF